MPEIDGDRRPGLAVISNTLTPYRVNLHRLIAGGIPELKLHTIVTHGVGDFDWEMEGCEEIHVANVSHSGEHANDFPLAKPVSEWRKWQRLRKHLKENSVVAVIFNGYRYLSYLRLMEDLYRRGVPFFVRNDSNIRGDPTLPAWSAFVKQRTYAWWLKRTSGVFSMGDYGDAFFRKYGATDEQLYRVPYWPDYDAYAQVDVADLERFKRQYALDDARRYLVYSGRLVPEKRVDLLVDAFASIARDRSNWDLLIVGDGVLRNELRSRVPDALQKRVVWTGFLDRNEPALAYHAGDVLVLPSEMEPWAVVIQEAMAAGLAIVASDVVGAARELVRNDVGGRIFESGSCQSLAQALIEVTQEDRIDAIKRESLRALNEWRQSVDPVAEIRRALRNSGVLPGDSKDRTHQKEYDLCARR